MMHRRHHRRFGYSLIEMMVVITVGSVLLLITGAWMHQSLRFASGMRTQTEHHTNLIRCGWQFRDDVHAAESMSLDGNTLTLKFKGAETIYTLLDSRVLVETTRGDDILREQFALASQSEARWDDSAMPQQIGLIIARAHNSSKRDVSLPIDLHVEAEIQRWQDIKFLRKDAEPLDGTASEKNSSKPEADAPATAEEKGGAN